MERQGLPALARSFALVYVLAVNAASDALVLLGHGTALNPDSCTAVLQHAERLRERRIFGEVHAAFWKQEPRIQDVLAGIQSPRVFIVPMFMSEGYFSGQIIPAALGFGTCGAGEDPARSATLRQGNRVYTEPVGTHPEMTRVVLQRAEEVVRQFPFPRSPVAGETTLFIAGHGTGRNAESRKSVERQVEILRAQGAYFDVHAIFMEEEPLIRDWRGLTKSRNAVVVPFFISEGLHVAEDIPVLLGEPERVVKERLARRLPPWRNPTEKQGVLVWYASSVGTSPAVAEVILARVQEAVERGG